MQNRAIESARILVVDDEESVLSLVRDIMAHDGYEVFTASSVTQAMRIARRASPDIIITDLVMPQGSGYDLIAALYKHPKTYATPILALTADGELVLSRFGDDRGLFSLSSNIAAYIAKPFSAMELRTTVLAVLHAAQLGRFHPGEPYHKALGRPIRLPRELRFPAPPKRQVGK